MPSLDYRKARESDIPEMARIRATEWETEDYWNRRIRGYLAGELDPKFGSSRKTRYGFALMLSHRIELRSVFICVMERKT